MPAKKKPSILIIDPDTHLSDILMARFHLEGWTARAAKSIEQAKKMLARKASEVILLDPKDESEPEKHALDLIDHTAERARTLIVHTASFTRGAQVMWKQSKASVVLKKGEHSLSDFVKKIKKIHTS